MKSHTKLCTASGEGLVPEMVMVWAEEQEEDGVAEADERHRHGRCHMLSGGGNAGVACFLCLCRGVVAPILAFVLSGAHHQRSAARPAPKR